MATDILSIDELRVKIFERIGSGFSLGVIAGAIMYFSQGLIFAPRGQRLVHGITHMRNRAPLLGGTLAVWSGSFAATSGGLHYYREKDDEWNDSLGGFITGFLVNVRSGGTWLALN